MSTALSTPAQKPRGVAKISLVSEKILFIDIDNFYLKYNFMSSQWMI